MSRIPAPDAATFKSAAQKFPSGVTIVTVGNGGQVLGITVSSFCSLSLEPLQVLVCVHQRSRLHQLLLDTDTFVVNVLAEHQQHLAEFFAHAERFADEPPQGPLQVHWSTRGAPIIGDCVAAFECVLGGAYPSGDHTIIVGEVVHCESRDDCGPAVYWSRDFWSLGARLHSR